MSEKTPEQVYDLKSVEMPYLSGGKLKLFVSLLDGPAGGMLLGNLLKQAGIPWLREQPFNDWPTF